MFKKTCPNPNPQFRKNISKQFLLNQGYHRSPYCAVCGAKMINLRFPISSVYIHANWHWNLFLVVHKECKIKITHEWLKARGLI